MKFAHMADCHLGGWRDPVLSEINIQCFEEAFDICIDENVDFILISGDLFESSRPSIDVMEKAVSKIKEAADMGIQVYVIEGSHDFSPTGKTMLRVLEKAGLFERVCKGTKTEDGELRLIFTTDKETGAKLTGLIGRKGVLEKRLYKELDREAIQEREGFKIFMFHTGLNELKPEIYEHAEGMPVSSLPQGFDYYAGGHIHKPAVHEWKGYGKIVFPGATMPANFGELETFEHGGFYIVTTGSEELEIEYKELGLETYDLVKINVGAQDKTPEMVENDILEEIEDAEVGGKIVLLRVEGTLSSGSPSDIDFRRLISIMSERGAKLVKRKTSKLTTKEYEEIKVTSSNREELEDRLIKEHAGQREIKGFEKEEQIDLTKNLMETLSEEKKTDETNRDYNNRIEDDVLTILGIKEEWREYE